jgi:hypothetical protein
MTPLSLPYRFDTSAVVKLVLRGAGLLLVVIALGILYSLLVSHDRAAVLQLLVTGVIAGYFAWLFLRHLTATRGSITRDSVELEAVDLYGLRLKGPAGKFPLKAFSGVRVELAPPPVFAQGGAHERVILAGNGGVPDILVARTSRGAGRALGRDLAAATGLSYNEEAVPY